jgi:hypothetical protein
MRKMVVTAPRRHGGAVYVTVSSGDHGSSAKVAAAKYRYVARPVITEVDPARGPATGGHEIRIVGRNFVNVVRVRVGRVAVTPNRVIGSTRIWLTTPPHAPRTVDITVRTRYGVTAPGAADRYTFVAH